MAMVASLIANFADVYLQRLYARALQSTQAMQL